VKAETQKPQNQKHNENRPKHVYLLRSLSNRLSSLPRIFLPQLNSSERLPALQTKWLRSRSDEPTERAHPWGAGLAARCFHRRELSHWASEEGAQGAKMDEKRMQDGADFFRVSTGSQWHIGGSDSEQDCSNYTRSVSSHPDSHPI